MPDLIAIGVDALNPLQPDHLDPGAIKRRFGDRVALWGAVGSQALFGHGSPAEVREEVRRRIAELGPAGYVVAPAYDVDLGLHWENVLAFAEAVREARGDGG